MGYLIFLAAVRGLEDLDALDRIDVSMPWRAFRLAECDLVLVEWLQRPNRNNPPPHNMLRVPASAEFARRPAGVSFPETFGEMAPGLDDLYRRLADAKRAGTMPKVAVHLALRLSRLTGRPTLVVASDDEEWDLACEANDGRLEQLVFDAGEEDISVSAAGRVEATPAPSGPKRIHRIAEGEARRWCEHLAPLFGFDGDVSRLPIVEAARAQYVAEAPVRAPSLVAARHPKKKPFWKVW